MRRELIAPRTKETWRWDENGTVLSMSENSPRHAMHHQSSNSKLCRKENPSVKINPTNHGPKIKSFTKQGIKTVPRPTKNLNNADQSWTTRMNWMDITKKTLGNFSFWFILLESKLQDRRWRWCRSKTISKQDSEIGFLPESIALGISFPVNLIAVEPSEVVLPEELCEDHAHF